MLSFSVEPEIVFYIMNYGREQKRGNQIQWKVHGPHFTSVISLDYGKFIFHVALAERSYGVRRKACKSDQ